MSSRGGVSAVDMYALAKHSPLVLRRIFNSTGKTSCSNARAVFAAGSHHMPRWLWGLLRQARLPQFGQHSEFTSVLAARAQGQENAGVGYKAGKSDTPLNKSFQIFLSASCSGGRSARFRSASFDGSSDIDQTAVQRIEQFRNVGN